MNIKAYLHDFIKSILIYDTREAFEKFKDSGIRTKILSGDIVFTRGEPKGNKNYFDVFIATSYIKPDKNGKRQIICQLLFIEIKTGKYTDKWLDQIEILYKDRKTAHLNLFTYFEYDYKEKKQVAKINDTLSWKLKEKYKNEKIDYDKIHYDRRLIFICPQSEICKVEEGLKRKNFRHGTHFQIYPIEPIFSLALERINELLAYLKS